MRSCLDAVASASFALLPLKGSVGGGCAHLDTVDGQAGLSNVGRQHDLARARRRRLKNLRLHHTASTSSGEV